MRRPLGVVVGAVAICLPAAGDVTPTGPFVEVADFGGPAVDLPAGLTYGAIQTPIVDSSGTFLFASEIAGGTAVPGVRAGGIFLGQRGALHLVARAGDVAPGAGGATWSDVIGGGLLLRNGGLVAFPAALFGADAAHDGGIWAGTLGNLALVAREGDPAPGTTAVFANGTVDRFFQGTNLHLAMNESGVVALRAKLSGTGVVSGNDEALFAGMPGALALVARLGSAAPDAGGATFVKSGTETFSAPSITTSGNLLFRAHLTGTGVTGLNADGLWYGAPGALTIVVRSGQAVSGPGIPAASTLVGLGAARPVVNEAGQLLFEAPAFNGSMLAQAVWIGLPGALAPIAAAGAPAPDDAKGATFAGLFLDTRLNGRGQAVFYAGLSSAADFGLYGWDGTTLRRIARTGDAAPGMPAGETFGFATREDTYLNIEGQVLFRDVTSPSALQGIWLGDVTTGEVRLIAQSGVTATVSGSPRSFIGVDLYGGYDTAGSPADGHSSPLGADGTIAISAQFLDGHVAALTAGSGGGCADAGACLIELGGKLPDPEMAPDAKTRRVSKSLAKLLGAAERAVAKAETLTGRKQAKKYAAARKAVTRILAKAAAADLKGRLGATLADIQSSGDAVLASLPE